MKQGRGIRELAEELTKIRDNSHDYIVPASKLSMVVDGLPQPSIAFENKLYSPSNFAHGQIATYTGVPKAYYDRIRGENANLLASCVNHGLQMAINKASASQPESRMIRTVGEDVRAFLSSRYRRLDCYDLIEQVFPIMLDRKLQVRSSELTERRMFIKAFTDELQTEIKKGMVVGYGLCVSCSDVGAGAVKVQPMLREYVCDNGMIMDLSVRKYHVGRNQAGDDVQELYSDATKELDDAAFWAKIKDVVIGSMKPEIFERQANKLREAAGEEIVNTDTEEVVELAMKRVGVSGETTKNNIVHYLANGADGRGMNKWGLGNAFTWAAQAEEADYEEATDLERAGGKIIELTRKDWSRIAH